MATVHDPGLVIPTIAQVCGLKEADEPPLLDRLKEFLHQRTLLVLDNFEQVIAAAPDMSALLDSALQLKVIVTSRIALRMYSEHEFPLASLLVPEQGTVSLISLIQNPAVRLFTTRAQVVLPSFTITAEHAPIVAEICIGLNGVPLAIERAAARIKLLTPHAMLTRLSSQIKLLVGGPRDRPTLSLALPSPLKTWIGLGTVVSEQGETLNVTAFRLR